jgi:hypothetical protein
LFNFIEISYYIWCLFFYHAFKTRSGSWPLSCPRSQVGLNDKGYWGQSNFLLYRK